LIAYSVPLFLKRQCDRAPGAAGLRLRRRRGHGGAAGGSGLSLATPRCPTAHPLHIPYTRTYSVPLYL
jgi:hypothetical protein